MADDVLLDRIGRAAIEAAKDLPPGRDANIAVGRAAVLAFRDFSPVMALAGHKAVATPGHGAYTVLHTMISALFRGMEDDESKYVRAHIEDLKAALQAANAQYSEILTKIVAEERGWVSEEPTHSPAIQA